MFKEAQISKNNNAIDEELIALVSKKDKRAFDEFISRHLNMLYSIAYRMQMNRADAEDVVQETMMRVWQNAHMWDRDGGASVRTWIYTITHNICIDSKRKTTRRPHLELLEEPEDKGLSADKLVQKKQARRLVMEAINELPENQKTAIIFCHYQKLSNSEAAEVMGSTVKAVESLLVRAKKSLFDKLEGKRSLFEGAGQ